MPPRASAPTRSGSQKKSVVEREVIPEEMMDSSKRIDDLADGLDATDLRELMERDNRRRERKRQYDQDRMGRRLARKAESQRREEAEARQWGMESPQNLERGVLGRELVGLGLEPPSAVVTSSRKRDPPTPNRMSGIQEDQPRGPRELRIRIKATPDPQLSLSLASIDSEGSWLSGRVGSRRRSAMRDSIARANRRDRGASDSPVSSTHEEVAAGDDDYLSRLAVSRQSGEMAVERQSGDGRPSSDDEPMQEGDVRWGAVGAKPRVIRFHRHDRDTMRSREGLLRMHSDVEYDGDGPVSPDDDERVDDL
ncbi:hypothetical protein OCS_00577 [Ophiocordyceps sinensis CO18]|uniref:Uncharacterized protein n=1 Tax=Ophiocordyceps sinensis (strain Co18 / CGMCC 3.14243) TaxID=911162 RepID=T5APQ2_OPHSC|nr:hypothetical protein OCS_00577 [Ophiocordyceps sinensis CO18]